MNVSYHIRMRHITYECVVTRMERVYFRTWEQNESFVWVLNHMNASYHIWMRDVTYECVMSHTERAYFHTGEQNESFVCVVLPNMSRQRPLQSNNHTRTRTVQHTMQHTLQHTLQHICIYIYIYICTHIYVYMQHPASHKVPPLILTPAAVYCRVWLCVVVCCCSV